MSLNALQLIHRAATNALTRSGEIIFYHSFIVLCHRQCWRDTVYCRIKCTLILRQFGKITRFTLWLPLRCTTKQQSHFNHKVFVNLNLGPATRPPCSTVKTHRGITEVPLHNFFGGRWSEELCSLLVLFFSFTFYALPKAFPLPYWSILPSVNFPSLIPARCSLQTELQPGSCTHNKV